VASDQPSLGPGLTLFRYVEDPPAAMYRIEQPVAAAARTEPTLPVFEATMAALAVPARPARTGERVRP
jgi:hypothetical protein